MIVEKKFEKITHINLIENGIFPIVYDEYGVKINQKLDTGVFVPGTIQGEGKLLGVPSLIIRLSGCNLRCSWRMDDGSTSLCDTEYASFKPEKNLIEIDKVLRIVKCNIGEHIKHIIITGGEPMIQIEPLILLLEGLKKMNLHITLETNATIYDERVCKLVDLVSMSPKLSSSTPWEANLRTCDIEYLDKIALRHEKFRYNYDSFQAWVDNANDYQMKFVVGSAVDIIEIKNEFERQIKNLNTANVFLMPLGLNREQLAQTTKLVLRECMLNGWRYTPRLHIDLFDTKKFV